MLGRELIEAITEAEAEDSEILFLNSDAETVNIQSFVSDIDDETGDSVGLLVSNS